MGVQAQEAAGDLQGQREGTEGARKEGQGQFQSREIELSTKF